MSTNVVGALKQGILSPVLCKYARLPTSPVGISGSLSSFMFNQYDERQPPELNAIKYGYIGSACSPSAKLLQLLDPRSFNIVSKGTTFWHTMDDGFQMGQSPYSLFGPKAVELDEADYFRYATVGQLKTVLNEQKADIYNRHKVTESPYDIERIRYNGRSIELHYDGLSKHSEVDKLIFSIGSGHERSLYDVLNAKTITGHPGTTQLVTREQVLRHDYSPKKVTDKPALIMGDGATGAWCASVMNAHGIPVEMVGLASNKQKSPPGGGRNRSPQMNNLYGRINRDPILRVKFTPQDVEVTFLADEGHQYTKKVSQIITAMGQNPRTNDEKIDLDSFMQAGHTLMPIIDPGYISFKPVIVGYTLGPIVITGSTAYGYYLKQREHYMEQGIAFGATGTLAPNDDVPVGIANIRIMAEAMCGHFFNGRTIHFNSAKRAEIHAFVQKYVGWNDSAAENFTRDIFQQRTKTSDSLINSGFGLSHTEVADIFTEHCRRNDTIVPDTVLERLAQGVGTPYPPSIEVGFAPKLASQPTKTASEKDKLTSPPKPSKPTHLSTLGFFGKRTPSTSPDAKSELTSENPPPSDSARVKP